MGTQDTVDLVEPVEILLAWLVTHQSVSYLCMNSFKIDMHYYYNKFIDINDYSSWFLTVVFRLT